MMSQSSPYHTTAKPDKDEVTSGLTFNVVTDNDDVIVLMSVMMS